MLFVTTASGLAPTMLAAWLLHEEKVTGSRVMVLIEPPAASTCDLTAARLPSTAGEIRPSKAIFLPESEPPKMLFRPLTMPSPTPEASGLVEKK